MNFHKTSIFAALLTGAATISAAEPADYSSCEGKTGKALLQQLEKVVGNPKVVGYKSLYTVYETSDKHPDGTIWDMYSTKNWGKSFSAVTAGNYKYVGDLINREHSFPKSWFGKSSPMVSDAYHVYPTDGKVNGQRGNNPYGECANGEYAESNSPNVKPLGRLGNSTFPGYSGIVFEPDDQYKGDFARSYFYMAACYNSKISSWSSPMLAGNNYPCFSSWTVNLLLKWHRMDPVSDKETVRNDAVSEHQKNRNPFIDHPELVEYIWGDKVGQPWSLSAGSEPKFTSPVNNTTLDLGLTAINVAASRNVTVTGVNLKQDATVAVSGTGFSVSATKLSASDVNGKGATLTVSYNTANAGKANGKIVISSGDADPVTLNLLAEAIDGLPVLPASYVTPEAFTANWVNIDGAGAKYTLDVRRDNASIQGYPAQVDAATGNHRVTGLDPQTTYTYTISNGTLTSDPVSVTTAAPIPSVAFLYDGELEFSSVTGEPSDVAEVLVDIDYIPGDVTISVTTPFQLSLDKQQWGEKVVLAPGADRFYMRLYSPVEGHFTTSLTATADGYHNDDVEVEGTVNPEGASFVEDFEKQIPEGSGNGYSALTYVGNAATWYVSNTYFEYNGANSYAHSGYQAARFGQTKNISKYGPRQLYMLEDKSGGIGSVRFWARLWNSDKTDCTLAIYISDNHGSSWQKAGDVTVKGNNGAQNDYAEYSVTVNRPGSLRLKIEQTSGERCMIDDITLTDCRSALELLTPDGHAYHSWDAYCLDGQLVIENNDPDNLFRVYSIDGREVYVGTIPADGSAHALPGATTGLHIVNVADFSRRVLVK